MAEHKKNCIYGAVILVLLAAIGSILFYMIPMRYHLNREVTYSPNMDLIGNPLTGFAPPAENISACNDSQLVFIRLTWAEWEPVQGEFAIPAIEEKFHIKKWTEENKHAVLRFVCDIPGEERHMDVPEWLAKKRGEFSMKTRTGKAIHRITTVMLSKPVTGRLCLPWQNTVIRTILSPMWSLAVSATGASGIVQIQKEKTVCRTKKPAGRSSAIIP